MRFFNTEGPVRPEDHYLLPPLQRWDLDEVLTLIEQKKYFLLHAPRQTGKTSCLLALRDFLNRQGHYGAVYANLETAQAAREDMALAMTDIVQTIAAEARRQIGAQGIEALADEVLERSAPTRVLRAFLAHWCEGTERPLVLLLDEVDALVGDTLISLLRQLRAGYPQRPGGFPSTVILCGVRDLRDYRIHATSECAPVTGGSAFNIKAESLRLGDFSVDEVTALLAEHTIETGQAAYACQWSAGLAAPVQSELAHASGGPGPRCPACGFPGLLAPAW
ncbi:ATP-binding protein [Thiohalocapsa marina]|uniref:ATP-binding protein n=1 Tax=Thiohalocapsa marina TaxID=424902 RepID=UPI001FE76EFA|nr:ATP-binding protein [Thiohalocapsa marina]